VCHDGIFSTLAGWSTEELFFMIHDMGEAPWIDRDLYEQWDPSRFVYEWQTPQLIIHSELDYRLPISEGLAAFNALQSRNVPSKFLTFPDENHVSQYSFCFLLLVSDTAFFVKTHIHHHQSRR
jgi:dipeptidyl aminopeptidase/acylaminoacyl peptidase